jgi:ATP-dependent Clp protease ATP-binding subunit ClpC
MKDFFISYTKADKNWAEWIAWSLEEAGYQVIIQAWDFHPGGNFVLDMQEAAAGCDRTIAVLSPDFLKSAFTAPEWAAAFAKDPTGKKSSLLPVRVLDCSVEGLLGQIVYIDLVGLNENDAINTLLKGILRARGNRGKPSSPPGFPGGPTLGAPTNRVIPTLPPFPTTHNIDISEEEYDEGSLLDFLPHPLAAPLARFVASKNEIEQFSALDDTLKNFIKYLTAIALSQYWQDNPNREQLRAWLAGLSESRLLTSLKVFDQIGEHYRNAPLKPYLYPTLFERFLNDVDEDSSMGRSYKLLEGLAKIKIQGTKQPLTPRDFLLLLLEIRQIHWERNPQAVGETIRKKLFSELRGAITQLLNLFTPLFRYGLYYIERADRDGSDWTYTLVEFSGAEGNPTAIADPFREQASEAPPYKPNQLYLCTPQNQPLLNLHPLLISRFYKIYFLEYMDEEKMLVYGHCSSPERYRPPGHYHLLSTHLDKEPDEKTTDNDLVEDLHQASNELAKDESNRRIEEMPFSVLATYFSTDVKEALEIGLGESMRIGQFWLGTEFLLMGLSKQRGSPLAKKLLEIGVDGGELRGALRGMVGVKTKDWQKQHKVQELGSGSFLDLQEVDPPALVDLHHSEKLPKAVITPRLLYVLRQSIRLAENGKISTAHLLSALLQQHQSLAVNVLLGLLIEAKQDPNQWIRQLMQDSGAGLEDGNPAPDIQAAMPRPLIPIKGKTVLGQMGRDLTALAQAGQLRLAIGESAHKTMVQIGLILQQKEANNPILLGDPGVGKTAIVEGFAWRLANDREVLAKLAEKRIVDISANTLMSGTKYRGDLEERLQQLLTEVRSAKGQVVVFIDEIHTILGGKAEGGLGAIADALKPALSRGEFPCIGATTVGEYRRYIESDPALARRFTPVWLEEPSAEDTINIAREVARQHLGPGHGVQYPEETIKEAVRLAVRYLHDEFLPGKVIKLLDQAGPRVTMGASLRGLPVDPDQAIGGIVLPEIVRKIVSERTGIPLTSLSKDDKDKLVHLETILKERVKGQDEAVSEVVRVVKRSRAGLADPLRPVGVFLFAGPTGVGKTELALALAQALFDQEDAALRLDMSEYLEMHQVSRLIGSPPGYIGHGEEGQLTGRLRRRPYSVILLDEIEKAHKDVQHIFLQLFDAGRITDSRGHVADGRNAIFIMTTNLGAKEAMGLINERRSYKEKLQTAIEEHFSAEFLNRISRIVYFDPLTEDLLLAIFDKFFAQAVERFRAQNIEVEVADGLKRALCTKYTDVKRGARPLQRAIEDEIITPLADMIISGDIVPNMRVTVSGKVVEASGSLQIEIGGVE